MLLVTCLCSYSAISSSDQSWKDYFDEVEQRCLSSSEIKKEHISEPILFPDEAGVTGLLLEGEAKESKNNIRLLCLHNKINNKIYLSEVQ
ncbi:hypothetical protein SPG90_21855 (plasmid) [Enterobacter sp. D2]|uniref:hypothetical protein n=1 Tax=Enterobacter sp. D2 TaxID=3102784 RepID=UPI002ACA8466|nr:hypothetical protein [Enterobacter sp. D2]MDZ5731133.1 hypothetical protein [Enterobacter sp. D2]